MRKIKDKSKIKQIYFFFLLLGCLLVSAFVLCHWFDMLHAHSSYIGSANSIEAVSSVVQPLQKVFKRCPLTVAPGHRVGLKIFLNCGKRTDIWHLVLLGENVLFKESSPSIMVTRNPNWSTEILWYGTGYVKGKILSPLKRSA